MILITMIRIVIQMKKKTNNEKSAFTDKVCNSFTFSESFL